MHKACLLRRACAHKKSLLDSWKIQSSENILSILEGGRLNDTLFLNRISLPLYFFSPLLPARYYYLWGIHHLEFKDVLYLSVFSTISLPSFLFLFFSWDFMALVTKTGGFYRRTEKGVYFFCHLNISICLGG
jgi:hypothetical protein